MPLAIGSYTYDFCPSVSSVSSSTYPKKQFVTKKSVNKTKVPDFTVTRRLGGYVSIDLKHTNLVLDVYHQGNSLGKLLKFYLKQGDSIVTPSEASPTAPKERKFCTLLSVLLVHVLELIWISELPLAKDQEIITWPYHGGSNQLWKMVKIGSKYCFKLKGNLNLALGYDKKKSQLVVWTFHGTGFQLWNLSITGISSTATLDEILTTENSEIISQKLASIDEGIQEHKKTNNEINITLSEIPRLFESSRQNDEDVENVLKGIKESCNLVQLLQKRTGNLKDDYEKIRSIIQETQEDLLQRERNLENLIATKNDEKTDLASEINGLVEKWKTYDRLRINAEADMRHTLQTIERIKRQKARANKKLTVRTVFTFWNVWYPLYNEFVKRPETNEKYHAKLRNQRRYYDKEQFDR